MDPPLREVLLNNFNDSTKAHTDKATLPVNVLSINNSEINPDLESVLTRESDPHKPEHVKRIIQEVVIGPDTTDDQHQIIHELLREYADCFVLAIKEVNAIHGTVHKLSIPECTSFQTKIPPRSYNPDQRAFVDTKVNKMLEAGIIHPIHPMIGLIVA